MCVSVCVSLISSKRHGWSCLLSADHGQGPAPVRDSHRRLRGLFSHPAAPHHHLRLCVEVSTNKSNQIKKIAAKTSARRLASLDGVRWRPPQPTYPRLTPLSPPPPALFPSSRYIRSERSVILINFCLSIICSNALILVGQTQARNKVNHFFVFFFVFSPLFLSSLSQSASGNFEVAAPLTQIFLALFLSRGLLLLL